MTTTHANRTSLPLAGSASASAALAPLHPLAGPCSAVLTGLQFTPAPPTAVAVYGLCFVTFGIALVAGQRRARPTTRAKVQQA